MLSLSATFCFAEVFGGFSFGNQVPTLCTALLHPLCVVCAWSFLGYLKVPFQGFGVAAFHPSSARAVFFHTLSSLQWTLLASLEVAAEEPCPVRLF